MAETVYILCALTSIACMMLAVPRLSPRAPPLLFWSGAAFLAFAIANILLCVDLVMFPQYNLLLLRQAITASGVVLLLYGLIRTNN